MKKRLLKIIISCLLLLSLPLSTYAAIVSDNDGSAFVTKSEFEALKKDFDSQIDSYNSSIDLKIDGAIAAYLAGIVNVKTTAEVINKSWKEVTGINGVLTNTYKVPNVDLQFMMGSQRQQNTNIGTGSNFWYVVSHFSRLKYNETWGTIKNCYRNLVYTTGDSPSNIGDIIWDGQAVRYKEQWNISRMIQHHSNSGGSWPWLDQPARVNYSIKIRNFSTLKETGWINNNWDTFKATSWPIEYLWVYGAKPGETEAPASANVQVTFAASEISDNFRTSVSLDKDDEGNSKRYEHIVSYKGADEWRVSNSNWPNLINNSPENTIKSSNLNSAGTLDQLGRVFGAAHHSSPRNGLMQDVSITYEITEDSYIPSLGLFKVLRRADAMYQDNVKENLDVGNNTVIEKNKPKLNEGFQLLAARVDDEVEWEPIFNYTHVHNGSTTYATDNTHEVDIYFSNGPFTDSITTSNLIQVQVGNETAKKNYATTTNRKCKVKFEMPSNGLVYVKWVPHFTGTSYLDLDWLVTLDLKNCNTYTYFRP